MNKYDKAFIVILIIFIALNLSFSLNITPSTDEIIYLLMGKYFASFVTHIYGFYEFIRPPLLSFLLSPLFVIGVHNIAIFYVYNTFLMSLVLLVVYLLLKHLVRDKLIILFTMLMIITNYLFIQFSSRIFTSFLSSGFTLLALLILLKKGINNKSLFISGLILGISFITRFTQGVMYGSLLIILGIIAIKKKQLREFLKPVYLTLGFIIPIAIYQLFLLYLHLSIFTVLMHASLTVKQSTWFYHGSILYYFKYLLLYASIPLFLAIINIFQEIKHFNIENKIVVYTLMLYLLLMLSYYSFLMPSKQYRYITDYFLVIFVLSARAIDHMKNKKIALSIVSIFIVISLGITMSRLPIAIHKDYSFIDPLVNNETLVDTNIPLVAIRYPQIILSLDWRAINHNIKTISNNPEIVIHGWYKSRYRFRNKPKRIVVVMDYDMPCPPSEYSYRDNLNNYLLSNNYSLIYNKSIYVYIKEFS